MVRLLQGRLRSVAHLDVSLIRLTELLTLSGGRCAPDAVRFGPGESVVQALVDHGAFGADLFGRGFSLAASRAAFVLGREKRS